METPNALRIIQNMPSTLPSATHAATVDVPKPLMVVVMIIFESAYMTD